MANRFARFVEPAQPAPAANRFARFAQDAAQEPPTLNARASGSAGVEAPKSAWIDETMGQYTRDRAGIARLESEAKAAGVPLGRAVKWKRNQLERQDREGVLQAPTTAPLSLGDANESSVNERAAIIRAAEQIQSSPLATWPNTGSKTSIPGEGDDAELTSALDVLENYRKQVSPEIPGPQFMRQMFPRGTAQESATDPDGSWGAAGESMLQGIRQSVAGGAQALGEKLRYAGNYVPAVRGLLDAPANALRTEGYEQGAASLDRMSELGAGLAQRPTGSVYDDPDGWARYLGQQGVAGSGPTLVGMGAGLVNPVLGAATFMGSAAGSEYGRARIEDNATPSEAGVRAVTAAATEGIPEAIGGAAMLGRLPLMKLAQSTARGRAAIAMPVEAGTEALTEKANIELERARGKYISPEEESRRIQDAAVIGGVMGGTIGAGTAVAEGGASGLRNIRETIRQANSAADISSPMAAAFTRAAQEKTARILGPAASHDAATGAQIADDAFRAAGVGTVAAADIAEQDALARDLDAAQRDQLLSENDPILREVDAQLTGSRLPSDHPLMQGSPDAVAKLREWQVGRIGAGDGSNVDGLRANVGTGNAGDAVIPEPGVPGVYGSGFKATSDAQSNPVAARGILGGSAPAEQVGGVLPQQGAAAGEGRAASEVQANSAIPRELPDGSIFLPGDPATIRQRLADASERGVQAVHAAKDRDSYVSAVHSFGKSAASGTTVTDADTGIVYVIKKSRNEKTGAEHITFEVADGKGQNDFTFTTKADGTVAVTGEVSFPRAGSASVTPPQGMAREMDGVQGVRFGRNAWPEVQGVVGGSVRSTVGNREVVDAARSASLAEYGGTPARDGEGAPRAYDASGLGSRAEPVGASAPAVGVAGNAGSIPTQAAVAVDGLPNNDGGQGARAPIGGRGASGNVAGGSGGILGADNAAQPDSGGNRGYPRSEAQGMGRAAAADASVDGDQRNAAPPALRDLTDDERNFWPALTSEIRESIDNPGGRMIRNADGSVGRTKWADLGPMSGFWRERPAGWNSDDVLTALDRAQTGEKLSVKQRNIVEYAKTWVRQYSADNNADLQAYEQDSKAVQRESVRDDIESTLASVTDTSPEQRASTQSLGGDYTAKLLQYKKDRRAWGLNPQQEQEYQDLLELDRETGKVGGRPMVGVRNKTAYVDALDAGELLPVQGFTDADDFKTLNDKLGHAAGDDAIREIGDALVAEFGEGNVFHRSGDEFLFQGTDQADVDAKMQRVRDRLSQITLRATDASGNVQEQRGIGLSYGTGTDEASADAALVADKQRRKESGQRVGQRRTSDHRGVGEESAGEGIRSGEGRGDSAAEGVGDARRDPSGSVPSGTESAPRVPPRNWLTGQRTADQGDADTGNGQGVGGKARPSVQSIRAAISAALGPKFLARLDNQRWFQIVDSVADLPPDVRKSITGGGIAGFVLGNRVFVVAEDAAGNPVGVLLHELGVHYGMTGILGEDFAPTLAKFKRLRAKDDRVGRAYERATEAADKDKNGELTEAAKATLDEEALAYFVEENWDSPDTRGIVAKVIDAIKSLLNRLGIPLSTLNASPEMLRKVAIGAARKAADGRVSVGKDGGLVYARDLLGEAPSETAQLVAQWKAKVDAKLRGDGRAYVKPSEGPGDLFGGPVEETSDLFAKPQQRAQGTLFSRKRDNSTAAEDRALDRGNLEEAIRIGKRRITEQREALGDISNGVILKMDGRDSWAIVMPDVEGGGKWRMQMFDRRGFVGHRTRDSRDAALNEALQDKYTTRDDGALDELQDSPEFVRGNFIAGEMMQLNAGKITSAEFDKRIADYDSSVEVKAKYSRRADGGKTITIDGTERPTTDSTGKAIHPTEEGLRNFWRWFGDSKVVDDQGRPLVVYHGSQTAGFGVFDPEKGGKVKGAVFFTSSRAMANTYASRNHEPEIEELEDGEFDPGPGVYSAYLKIERPYEYDFGGAGWDGSIAEPSSWRLLDADGDTVDWAYSEEDAEDAVENGDADSYEAETDLGTTTDTEVRTAMRGSYDGAILLDVMDSGPHGDADSGDVYVMFSAGQVKSAAKNSGAFSPTDKRIAYSRKTPRTTEQAAALAKAGMPEDSRSLIQRGKDYLGAQWASVKELASSNITQSVFDRFHRMSAIEQDLGIPPERSAYLSARLAAGLPSIMEGLMMYAAPKWEGGVLTVDDTTVGLLDALKPVKDDINGWLGWMVGRRASALKAQGRENLMSDADIDALLSLSKGKEAEFKNAALNYLRIKKAVLDVAEQAGLIDPVGRASWDSVEYIPFYRQDETEGDTIGPGTRQGLSNQSSGIQKLKGGTQNLADPLGNIVRNFTRLIDASLKNNSMLEAVKEYGPAFFEKVPMSGSFERIAMSQVKKVLLDRGVPQTLIDAMPQDALIGLTKLWAVKPPTDDDVVRVMRDGKPEYYRVPDKDLLASLTAFKVPSMHWALSPFKFFKKLLTVGVTSSPEFMARNFVRDSLSSWVISDDKFRVGWDSVKGIISPLLDKTTQKEMMFAGSSFIGGQFYSVGSEEATADALRRALRDKGLKSKDVEQFIGTIARTPLELWDKWQKIGSYFENANRNAIYENAIKAGRSKKEAAYLARDLMDFSMHGNSQFIQFLSDVLPFFNARLQGLYKLYRQGGKKALRKALLMRAGTVVAGTLALMAWNMVMFADGYDELEEWDKDTYWHIMPGTPWHIRVPKPFELGVLFATVPERVARAVTYQIPGGDAGDRPRQTLDSFLTQVGGTLALNPIPQGVMPIVEQWANKTFFTGRPIENMGDEKLLPEARAEWYTSDTARIVSDVIGNKTGLSPKRIEHLWNGYTGTVGAYALDTIDWLVRSIEQKPDRPELAWAEMPLLKAFYRGDMVPKSTRYSTEFYDIALKTEQISNTIKEYEVAGEKDKAKALEEKHADLLGSRKPSRQAKAGFMHTNVQMLNKAKDELAEIRKQIEGIVGMPGFSAEEKREKIEALAQKRNKIARDITIALRRTGTASR